MKRLAIFCAFSGLVLSSPAPPPSQAFAPAERSVARAAPDSAGAAAAPAPAAAAVAAVAPVQVAAAAARVVPVASAAANPSGDTPWSDASAARAKAKDEAALKNGWKPQSTWRKRKGGVRVVISLPQQKAYVFRHGALVATSPVSTGRRGYETPAGTFPILQKKVHHRSSKYDNAPMPYMQRLTHYGIALHAGSLPGYPASHGCIRLPRSFAKKLYWMTDHSTRVTVTRQRPKSAKDALRLA